MPSVPPGWQRLSFTRTDPNGVDTIPVATDGFVVMEGYTGQLNRDDALAGLTVRVTTSANVEVPGSVSFLASETNRTVLGWSASSPLGVGTELHASLSAVSGGKVPLTDDVELVVVGEPPALSGGQLFLEHWSDHRHGVGASVPCSPRPGVCSSPYVPEAEMRQLAAIPRWAPPAVSTPVAWQARVSPVERTPDAETAADPITFVIAAAGGDPLLPRVVFPSPADELCVNLEVSDLRTGVTLESETCSAPGSDRPYSSDTRLGDCAAPPNQALTESWCKARGQVPSAPECAPFVGTGGSGLGWAGGSATSDTLAGAPGPRTASACQLGGPPRGASSAILALLGLGLLRRRRAAMK